jgi:hypothetical protein
MSFITIEIGRGVHSCRSLIDAADEWVWMRIHELRQCQLSAPVRVIIQTERVSLTLLTPEVEATDEIPGKFNRIEQQIVEIWKSMGMNCPSFTAGGALFFIQRLRLILDKELQGLQAERDLTEF